MPPGQEHAERHVAHHPQANGFLEQLTESVDDVMADRRRLMGLALREVPVLPRRDRAVFKDEQVSRQQFVNTTEQRVLTGDRPSAEHFGQEGFVRLRFHQSTGENRLDLRSEQQGAVRPAPVERLDAEPIAHEQEPPLRRVPDREREHAAEALDALVAPLLVRMDDRLGIGPRPVDVAVRLEILGRTSAWL